MRNLMTKRGRAQVARIIRWALKEMGARHIVTEVGEGEGQGEVSFENFTILGQEDGKFAISFAVETPGSYDEPPGVDVVEMGVRSSLDLAIMDALKLYVEARLENLLQGEFEAQDLQEERDQ